MLQQDGGSWFQMKGRLKGSRVSKLFLLFSFPANGTAGFLSEPSSSWAGGWVYSSSRTKAETPSSDPTSLLWELCAFFAHGPEGTGWD